MDKSNHAVLKEKVDRLKISDNDKEEINSIINDMEVEFNRLKKSTDMQIEELEQEKEILLGYFIEKDKQLDKVQKSRIIHRGINKIRRIAKGILRRIVKR